MTSVLYDAMQEGRAKTREGQSQFVRSAIRDALVRLKILISDDAVKAPDRIGKGGPRKVPVVYIAKRIPPHQLNEGKG